MASSAPAEQEHGAYAPELPVEVLRCILAHHANDLATLCAAACVARAWRSATRAPSLWRLVSSQAEDSDRLVTRLNAARLRYLLSSGGTEVVRLSRCDLLTAHDVADALVGQPPLRELHVAGMAHGVAPRGAHADALLRLRAAVQDEQGLDVLGGGICAAMERHGGASCRRLCMPDKRRCGPCALFACDACSNDLVVPPARCPHLCSVCWHQPIDGTLTACLDCRHVFGLALHMCGECTLVCNVCLDTACREHHAICAACELPHCRREACATRCEACGEVCCASCTGRHIKCIACDAVRCHRSECSPTCQQCDATFCPDCADKALTRCVACRELLCDSSVRETCSEQGTVQCSNCREQCCAACERSGALRRSRGDPEAYERLCMNCYEVCETHWDAVKEESDDET